MVPLPPGEKGFPHGVEASDIGAWAIDGGTGVSSRSRKPYYAVAFRTQASV
jgi:hypothetical protein